VQSNTLKNLQVRRGAAEAAFKNSQALAKDAQKDNKRHLQDMEKYRRMMNDYDKEITRLKKGIIVSEHAMLRYFERVLGFNLEEIKALVLPPEDQEIIKAMGNGTFPINKGTHKVTVVDSVITTVLTKDMERD
jgi:hypothetical protein